MPSKRCLGRDAGSHPGGKSSQSGMGKAESQRGSSPFELNVGSRKQAGLLAYTSMASTYNFATRVKKAYKKKRRPHRKKFRFLFSPRIRNDLVGIETSLMCFPRSALTNK